MVSHVISSDVILATSAPRPTMKEKTKLCCCTTFFILTLVLAIAFVASYVAFPYAVEYVVAKVRCL